MAGFHYRWRENYNRWRRFPNRELVNEITNSPSTAIPRITTITAGPPDTRIICKGGAKTPSLFFNELRWAPRAFVSEKGTILSCQGCNPFPLVGAVHLARPLHPERFV